MATDPQTVRAIVELNDAHGRHVRALYALREQHPDVDWGPAFEHLPAVAGWLRRFSAETSPPPPQATPPGSGKVGQYRRPEDSDDVGYGSPRA